tara:strand:+ start:150 stop:482 length:333 start_codon:yes stop_codon:yes gene_type:complete
MTSIGLIVDAGSIPAASTIFKMKLLKEKIKEFVEEYINPAIASHGGHLAVEDFDDEGVLHVRFSGGCQGCAASKQTLQVQVGKYLTEEFPEITGIVDLTDHSSGENPYYA